MAIPKIIGSETEYSITTRNASDQDPVTVSTLVVNGYKEHVGTRVIWDYDQENPLMDARGFRSEGDEAPPPDKENNSIINDIPNSESTEVALSSQISAHQMSKSAK